MDAARSTSGTRFRCPTARAFIATRRSAARSSTSLGAANTRNTSTSPRKWVPSAGRCSCVCYWTDARRLSYYAVVGYVVAPTTLPDMFAALHERKLGALLQRRGGDLPLELRVTDEQGQLVFGRLSSEASATVPVSMEFYPVARIESRLVAGGLTPRLWRFEVSASARIAGCCRRTGRPSRRCC